MTTTDAPHTASRGLADRATRDGLLDIGYGWVDSPLGPLLVAATPVGVVRIGFAGTEGADRVLADLAARVSPRVLAAPRRVDDARRQLAEYFDGRRTRFSLALDPRLIGGFRRRILDVAARIPYGATATYTEVAARAGSPGAVRAAGSALAGNPLSVIVPCHRVVRTNGGLGGYLGGLDAKRLLLDHERAHAEAAAG